MALKDQYASKDEIPEAFRELYTERDGRWECTGISGMKTSADVDRVQRSLDKERSEHSASKAKLREHADRWGELDYDDVMSKLDRIPELEEAAKGKLDDDKIEEIVSRRVDSRIKTKTAPLERDLAKLTKERDSFAEENQGLKGKERVRTIRDSVQEALIKSKVIDAAREDALFRAEYVFDLVDGKPATKEGVGVTPGLDPSGWLEEIQPNRPHWWGDAQGGGASGSGGGGPSGENYWAAGNWNVTKQGQYIKEHGMEKAKRMAERAGSSLNATHPPKKSS